MIEERVIPGISPVEVMQEHLDRYLFVLQYVKGKRVLDVACGSGYGSQLLAKEAKSVVGVDISPYAIEYAQTHYPADNLQYIQEDATKLPFEDDSFDVVVSFETIEHIEDYTTFLRECRRVLRQSGLFICSTPNSLISSPNGNIINPYHVIEFSYEEFTDTLQDHFTSIQMQGQRDVNPLKNYIISSYLFVKNLLGIKQAIFTHKNDAYSFPVSEFKNGLTASAYMIAICEGRSQ